MAWYNPFSWRKKRDKSLDSWEAANKISKSKTPSRFSLRDRFAYIRSDSLRKHKKIVSLIKEWNEIAPLYVLVVKKSKANFMVASMDTIKLMQNAEFNLFSNRLTEYADDVDVLQSKLHTYRKNIGTFKSNSDRQIKDAAIWNYNQASRVLSDVLRISEIVKRREIFMERVSRTVPEKQYYSKVKKLRAPGEGRKRRAA